MSLSGTGLRWEQQCESASDTESESDDDRRNSRRKRAAAHRIRLMALAAAFYEAADGSHLGPTGPKEWATRKDWRNHLRVEGPRKFRRMYRMEVEQFEELFNLVRPALETQDVVQAERSSGSEVCAEVRLAITLRYLAGGSYLDVCSNFGVSNAEFYRSVWRCVDAINDTFPIDFPIDDEEELTRLEEGWARKSRRQTLRGVVGAIDGRCIWQTNPGLAVHNPSRYYCARKDKFALLLMAICDSDRRFRWFDISATPTTHDSLAWIQTKLGQRVKNGDLPARFFFIGDCAFTNTHSMISPGHDDDFNFEHSSMRINIECAFGLLVRRWGILWRSLEMDFNKSGSVVGCCIRLHNFCINKRLELNAELRGERNPRLEVQPGRRRKAPYLDRDGVPVQNLRSDLCRCSYCLGGSRTDTSRSDPRRRAHLERIYREAGLRRPPRRG